VAILNGPTVDTGTAWEIGFHGGDAVALLLGALVCGLFLAVRLAA
jgi:hypothetical protein